MHTTIDHNLSPDFSNDVNTIACTTLTPLSTVLAPEAQQAFVADKEELGYEDISEWLQGACDQHCQVAGNVVLWATSLGTLLSWS